MSDSDLDDDIPDVPMSMALRGEEPPPKAQSEDKKDEDQEKDGEKPDPEEQPLFSQGEPPRREFISIALGGAMVAAPALVGLRVVASPLFSGKAGGVLARLTTVDSLVPGGPPQAFKVVADKKDAWTTYKDLPLGLVYAQRSEDGKEISVFSASCPHAGCAVEFRKGGAHGSHYYCPCHESSFNPDGSLAPDNTQAKRGLDSLEVDEEKFALGEVWVRFQKFKAGVAEKEAIS